jgi:hypothetical protein
MAAEVETITAEMSEVRVVDTGFNLSCRTVLTLVGDSRGTYTGCRW